MPAPFKRKCQHAQETSYRAVIESVLQIDYSQIAYPPGIRTAVILMLEWTVFGIGNDLSTPFQLACLYVGLTDPSGSLPKRLRYMGLTVITVTLLGTLLPALLFNHKIATAVMACVVALSTGYSLALGSPALFQAMKLGTALFAIQGAILRSRGELPQNYILLSVLGALISLGVAILPEIVGTHEALRTDCFKIWHGLGRSILQDERRRPRILLVIFNTQELIPKEEDNEWFRIITSEADTLHATSFCLSNLYSRLAKCDDSLAADAQWNALWRAVGRFCCRVAEEIQFPWASHYLCRMRLRWAVQSVQGAAAALTSHYNEESPQMVDTDNKILLSLVALILTQVESVAAAVTNVKVWPRYSSPTTLPQRIWSAIPTEWPELQPDESWEIRGYALRFAFAFTLATVVELVADNASRAHWFPMTVALIMGPTHAAAYEKVAHRTVGTIIGLGLGAALAPLFNFHSSVLILLLGLNTFAAVLFIQASYVVFTCFITGWVYVTIVGAGAAIGSTTAYRFLWTLAAGVLVLLVMYVFPPKREYTAAEHISITAKALKSYATAVVEETRLRDSVDENESCLECQQVEAAKKAVAQARQKAVQARVRMSTSINEAALAPSEGYTLDLHSTVTGVASDLLEAAAVPQSVSLICDGSADGLLSDVDQITFEEIDRLVERLGHHEKLEARRRDCETSESSLVTSLGRGAFSNAIANAHQRLTESGIPSHHVTCTDSPDTTSE